MVASEVLLPLALPSPTTELVPLVPATTSWDWISGEELPKVSEKPGKVLTKEGSFEGLLSSQSTSAMRSTTTEATASSDARAKAVRKASARPVPVRLVLVAALAKA